MNPSSSSSASMGKRDSASSFFDIDETRINKKSKTKNQIKSTDPSAKAISFFDIDKTRINKDTKYDVFLSYSNEETGKGFVSHLKGALEREGFTISNKTLLPDETSPMAQSHVYLVVFSNSYASSPERLDELASIIDDCLPRFNNRRVFPLFFNIEPSDVKKQKGPFKEAFQYHKGNIDPQRLQKWKKALKNAALNSGLSLKEYRDEAKFIKKIIKKLRTMQNPEELFDEKCRVGVESRAQDIISALRLSDQVFNMVAVLGFSGSGKTTVVKAVYDKIAADFEYRCFIEDVYGYEDRGRNWKVELQNDVISRLTRNDKRQIIVTHTDGAARIRKLIIGRKVLLILDNVDTFDHLDALGIHRACASFSCESRIIVTTRNKLSLGTLKYTPYNIRLLEETESFELFVRLTFEKNDPVDKRFVQEIVWRAGGLPLVLDVWSRHFKSHERELWPKMLEELRRVPHEDVQKKLQISYDSLNKREKKLFLDIACFFVGMRKDLVVKVLEDEDLGFFPEISIDNLVAKGLVQITSYGDVSLHHVIREMGEEVVRQENEDEPGRRTRLIDESDVDRVLEECSGTQSVESIIVQSIWRARDVIETFRKMNNLRLIKIFGSLSNSSDDAELMIPLSLKKLRYMEWTRFPFKSINTNIEMGNNVVVLKLRNSKLEILWEGMNKSLKKLRILDVSHSISLTKTGDLLGFEKLEELFRWMYKPGESSR